MKINKIEVLISKIELKKNSKGEAYLIISLMDLASGDNFELMSKDIELMSSIKPMMKYKVDLDLVSSKYGLKLEFKRIIDELGAI